MNESFSPNEAIGKVDLFAFRSFGAGNHITKILTLRSKKSNTYIENFKKANKPFVAIVITHTKIQRKKFYFRELKRASFDIKTFDISLHFPCFCTADFSTSSFFSQFFFHFFSQKRQRNEWFTSHSGKRPPTYFLLQKRKFFLLLQI